MESFGHADLGGEVPEVPGTVNIGAPWSSPSGSPIGGVYRVKIRFGCLCCAKIHVTSRLRLGCADQKRHVFPGLGSKLFDVLVQLGADRAT